jgi:purine nucleoside phosphorylase
MPFSPHTGPRLGIIGGSGLYEMDGLTDMRPVRLSTSRRTS